MPFKMNFKEVKSDKYVVDQMMFVQRRDDRLRCGY